MKIHVTKDRFGALRPADREAEQAFRDLTPGEYLTCEIKKPRNPKFHKMLFALLTVVHDNLPDEKRVQWPTVERLLWEIKIQAGYVDFAQSIGGKTYPIPHSISFAAMDDLEFSQFFDKAIEICRLHFIPGITERELREAVDAELAAHAHY